VALVDFYGLSFTDAASASAEAIDAIIAHLRSIAPK
jgi:hypothetical protein